MTVSSQTSTATFVGNGVATAFPLPFRFFNNSDIRAYFIDSTTGASTLMALGTDYTLTGSGEPEVDGSALSLLTTTVPLASLRGLYVERVMSQVQETDIVNQGQFFASTHEDVFDRLTMLIQQANANSNGAIRVAIGDVDPVRLPPTKIRAGKILTFDTNGDPVATVPAVNDSSGLAVLLADQINGENGAGLVGYKGRTVAERLGDSVSVKDFGAKCDGVSDDTSAIQAASDSVEADGGGIVFLPTGTSIISSAIRVGGGVTLRGEGAGVSIIKLSPTFPANQAAIRNKNINVAAYTYDDSGIVIERLQVNGNGNVGRLTGLIDLLKTQGTVVQLCKITNSDYIGITDGGNLNLSIVNNELTDLGKITGVSPTIWSQSYIADGTLSRGTKVIQNHIHDNNRTGLQAASMDMLVDGNYFKKNGESTIFMNSNSLNCKIVNNKIERATRTDISAHGIEVGGSGHLISGNYIYDVDGMGISLTDVSNSIVTGNYVESYRVDTAFYTPAWGCPAIGITNSPVSPTVGLLVSNNKVVKGAGGGENAITVYHQALSVACSGVQILDNDLQLGGTSTRIFYQSAIAQKLGSNCQVRGNSGHPSRSGVVNSFQAGASVGTFTVTGLPFPPHRISFNAFHSAVNEVRTSQGIATKDSTASTQWTAINTSTNANAGAVTGSNTVVRIADSAGTDLFRATITSYEGADGLSFTIDKSVALINPVILYEALP